MDTLKEVSDRSENWARYLSAQDAMRVKISDDELREQAQKDLYKTKEELLEAKGDLSETKDQLSKTENQLSEKEKQLNKYREKLIAMGINPDED